MRSQTTNDPPAGEKTTEFFLWVQYPRGVGKRAVTSLVLRLLRAAGLRADIEESCTYIDPESEHELQQARGRRRTKKSATG
jgi:hypothetical protein